MIPTGEELARFIFARVQAGLGGAARVVRVTVAEDATLSATLRGLMRRTVTVEDARLIGAIIAGGANSRFGGEPKGLHTVGRRRIIDRVADALRGRELRADPHQQRARCALDWLPGSSRRSVTRGASAEVSWEFTRRSSTRQSMLLVVAWDMPFVTTELFALIRDRARDERVRDDPRERLGTGAVLRRVHAGVSCPSIEAALGAGDLRLCNCRSSVCRRYDSDPGRRDRAPSAIRRGSSST